MKRPGIAIIYQRNQNKRTMAKMKMTDISEWCQGCGGLGISYTTGRILQKTQVSILKLMTQQFYFCIHTQQ